MTPLNSPSLQNTLNEACLDTLVPNEILSIVFDQVVNQKCPFLCDISSILLTCKKWKSVLEENPCISLAQTLFQLKKINFSPITRPQECIATRQKEQFTSQEINLIERAQQRYCYPKEGFKRLLMGQSQLFHPKSLFLSILDHYPWDPEVCKNSANENIRKVAEEQLSILNSLTQDSDEKRLTVIKNDAIAKLYPGIQDQSTNWPQAKTSVISTLKQFFNFNDKKIFIQVARCFGRSVFDIHESLRKDRDIVLVAVKYDGLALYFADESFRKDRNIVLAAIQKNSWALQWVDESLKKDREIVLAAVNQNGLVLQWADRSFQKDREIVLNAVKQDGLALANADENFKKDQKIVLAAVQQNGWALKFADESLKKDPEIVLIAVQQYGFALEFADEILKKDREIVLAAVQQNGWALKFADESLKKDPEIVLAAVQQYRSTLELTDESLKEDLGFVQATAQQDEMVRRFICNCQSSKNPEIVLTAVQK